MPEERQLSDRRCSVDQALFGLHLIYEQTFLGRAKVLTLETPFRTLIGDDPEGFVYDLNDVFDIWISFDRVDDFLNNHATVGEFVEFLRSSLPRVSLAPVQIAGTSCDKAAAFLTVEAILRSHNEPYRIAPSQQIRDVLSFEEIDRLWQQLHWVLQGQDLPRERWNRSRVIDSTSCWQCVWLTLSIGVVLVLGGIPELMLVFGLLAFLLACAARALMTGMSPLPNGVETFRDLASMIARQQQGRVLV